MLDFFARRSTCIATFLHQTGGNARAFNFLIIELQIRRHVVQDDLTLDQPYLSECTARLRVKVK